MPVAYPSHQPIMVRYTIAPFRMGYYNSGFHHNIVSYLYLSLSYYFLILNRVFIYALYAHYASCIGEEETNKIK